MTGKKSSEIGVSTGLLNRMRKSQIADVGHRLMYFP